MPLLQTKTQSEHKVFIINHWYQTWASKYSNSNVSVSPSTCSADLAALLWFWGESPLPSSAPADGCASLLILLQRDHSSNLNNVKINNQEYHSITNWKWPVALSSFHMFCLIACADAIKITGSLFNCDSPKLWLRNIAISIHSCRPYAHYMNNRRFS